MLATCDQSFLLQMIVNGFLYDMIQYVPGYQCEATWSTVP